MTIYGPTGSVLNDIQQSVNDTPLPVAQAGSHIDVHIQDGLVRQYSLTGEMSETYQIAVQKGPTSRGGSIAMHERFQVGAKMTISPPRNNFALIAGADHNILCAGGIGLTPILAMAWELHISGRSFECHLSARSKGRVAFEKVLRTLPFVDKIKVYLDDDQTQSLDIQQAIGAHVLKAHLYVCGPTGYMDFVKQEAATAGLTSDQIHVEHFGAEIDVDGDPFEVVAQKSGVTVQVGPNQTILEALNMAGISVPTSCQNGVCGSCLTPVLEGKPDHRDLVLTDVEKSANNRIAVCCSRSNSSRLVIDL